MTIIRANITPLFACWVPLPVARVRGSDSALGLPGSVPHNQPRPLTTVYMKLREQQSSLPQQG